MSFTTLSSAESSLYRREDWREGKRNREGDDGMGKEKKLPPFQSFRSSHRPPRAIFRLLVFLLGYPAGASAEERAFTSNFFDNVKLKSA